MIKKKFPKSGLKLRIQSNFILILCSTVICLTAIIISPPFSLFDQKTDKPTNFGQSATKPLNDNKGIIDFNSKQATVAAAVKQDSQVRGIVSSPQPENTQPARSVYLGFWTEGFFNPKTSTLHPEKLKELETKIGKKVAIANYYRGWEELEKPKVVEELKVIAANGWLSMISANPYFFDRCQSGGLPLYRALAVGNCDEFLKATAKNLKQFGKPLFLRFAWEMNIPSMEWSIMHTGSTAQDFIQAWRRIRDIFNSQNATNVLMVFSPNAATAQSVPYSEIYPGDAYVDWVGLDGYNWGTTQLWSSWQTFAQIFTASYREIVALSPTKPLMIAEVNTTDVGGDKAVWYKDMLLTQIPQNFAKVKAVVFYNEDRTVQENVNWLIDISPQSLTAFSEGIAHTIYKSSF